MVFSFLAGLTFDSIHDLSRKRGLILNLMACGHVYRALKAGMQILPFILAPTLASMRGPSHGPVKSPSYDCHGGHRRAGPEACGKNYAGNLSGNTRQTVTAGQVKPIRTTVEQPWWEHTGAWLAEPNQRSPGTQLVQLSLRVSLKVSPVRRVRSEYQNLLRF